MQFTSQRQRLIAHNIANLSTPNYLATDVSTTGFQAQLRRAVENRRENGNQGPLMLEETREVQQTEGGGLQLKPRVQSDRLLFHDRNNRDLESSMQDLVENASVYRVAVDLLRSRYQTNAAAISERA